MHVGVKNGLLLFPARCVVVTHADYMKIQKSILVHPQHIVNMFFEECSLWHIPITTVQYMSHMEMCWLVQQEGLNKRLH